MVITRDLLLVRPILNFFVVTKRVAIVAMIHNSAFNSVQCIIIVIIAGEVNTLFI